MKKVRSAFILAAGEGTRLRPLTETIPKPLLPVFHKPLITFALDHFIALGIETIALNTRYLHGAFYRAFEVTSENPYFGFGHYEKKPLHIFHEHVHLDTGGALQNARSVLEQGTFLIHNGDILSDAPLQELIEHHYQTESMVTLLLRDEGAAKNVCYNKKSGLIEGFSGSWNEAPVLVTENSTSMVYAGIAIVEPSFLKWIPAQGAASIIPALANAIRAKERISGFFPQEYFWSDLGTPVSYFETHLRIAQKNWMPPYPLAKMDLPWPHAIHPSANIDPSALLEEMVVVGADAQINRGAHLKNCILLPGAIVAPNTELSSAIVCGTSVIPGKL